MILKYSLVHYAMIILIIMIVLGCIMFFHIWAQCYFYHYTKINLIFKLIFKNGTLLSNKGFFLIYKIIHVHLHNYE